METKIAIITGASSGIGRHTAASLIQKGCRVYDFSRRDISIENVTHIKVDVTDEDNVNKAIEEVFSNEGRIDIVINCAGYGISGAVEFTDLPFL